MFPTVPALEKRVKLPFYDEYQSGIISCNGWIKKNYN